MAKKKEENLKVKRVAVKCIYLGWDRTRDFTTPHNMEAVNMLKNLLDRKGVKNQKGVLVFEYVEGEEYTVSADF